jgi:hypothetical protein
MMLTTFSEGDCVARAIADGAAGLALKAGAPLSDPLRRRRGGSSAGATTKQL